MKKYFGKVPNNVVSSNFILGKPQTSLFYEKIFWESSKQHCFIEFYFGKTLNIVV